LKKKNDEKEKVNQGCEDHEQMFVVALSANDHTTYDWIVHSGATQHMTFEQEWFTTYERISRMRVFMGDDTILEAIGKGSIKAIMQVGGQLTHTTITQVLHVPKMKNNLILVSKLISEGFKVEFDKDGCKVNDARGVVVPQARRDKNLYFLNVNVLKDMAHVANSLEESAMLWHEKLGHLNMASLKELDAMVDGMNLKEVPLHHICERCVKGKHQRTSFPKDRATRASQLLEIVHTDVCGPMKTTSHGGARYFLTFIDDFSRKTHVYLLKAKEKRLKSSNNTRRWWRTKLVTKSKCYVPTMEENLCLRNLTHFLRNVEFNYKQVRPIPHNKTVLRNVPIEPSWNVQEA
jgi:hypothetical protein